MKKTCLVRQVFFLLAEDMGLDRALCGACALPPRRPGSGALSDHVLPDGSPNRPPTPMPSRVRVPFYLCQK